MTPWRVRDLREQVVDLVRQYGYRRLDAPVRLASGEMSLDYIDGKRALAYGPHLKLACEALLELVERSGAQFDAVGGLTLGADQFAHVAAVLSERSWFVVRKKVKDHGTRRRIEGADLAPGMSVLLVDDVVTTGGSILEAREAIEETGATVAMAITLVDRGDIASQHFARVGIPYQALVTYRDLDIEPVGRGQGVAEATG